MATKYIAKLDGVIVGKRTTANRKYSHCVVSQGDEAAAAERAYNWVPPRSDYDYLAEVVAQGVNHKYVAPTKYRAEPDFDYLLTCKQQVEGGWEGFCARGRAIEIERFESARKAGAYLPKAHSWCGRLDLAQKEAGRISKWKKQVWVVEAEVA